MPKIINFLFLPYLLYFSSNKRVGIKYENFQGRTCKVGNKEVCTVINSLILPYCQLLRFYVLLCYFFEVTTVMQITDFCMKSTVLSSQRLRVLEWAPYIYLCMQWAQRVHTIHGLSFCKMLYHLICAWCNDHVLFVLLPKVMNKTKD